MVQQLIGLKHCKSGTSRKKDIGCFERAPDMVFALERQTVGGKVKQVPVILYKDNAETTDIDDEAVALVDSRLAYFPALRRPFVPNSSVATPG
jgi:hypothetical protein